jgi:hypothetical protein
MGSIDEKSQRTKVSCTCPFDMFLHKIIYPSEIIEFKNISCFLDHSISIQLMNEVRKG